METATYQLTSSEEILDQIQKSASLSDAEIELDKEAGIRSWMGKKLGGFLGRGGRSWFKNIKPGTIAGPNTFKGGLLKGMGYGKGLRESVLKGDSMTKYLGKGVNSGDVVKEIAQHGANKRWYNPMTWGRGGMSSEANKGLDFLKQQRKLRGNVQMNKGISGMATGASGGDAALAASYHKGLKRATGFKGSYTPTAAPLPAAAAPLPAAAAPTAAKAAPTAAAATAGATAKGAGLSESWKAWKTGGWDALTPQQKRTLQVYGIGGFVAKDPVFNALGVNNNRN